MSSTIRKRICTACRRTFSVERSGTGFVCPVCGNPLRFPLITAYRPDTFSGLPGIGRFDDALPIAPRCSLGEGLTPLERSRGGWDLAGSGLLFKVEADNITGSFKDRGSALVVSAAAAMGVERMAIASTGNAAASMSRYASQHGFELDVVVPSTCDAFKLRQMRREGVTIHRVDGGYSAAEAYCDELVKQGGFPAGSDNPYRLEGTKTLAYEIVEQTQHLSVDRIVLPIGTGNLMAAVRKGLLEMAAGGIISKIPKLDGVQLISVAPLDAQVEEGMVQPSRESVAGGINVPQAVLRHAALEAVKGTGGTLHRVEDSTVSFARTLLADTEDIDAEPTGAVCLAAYLNARKNGRIHPDETTVVLVTGGMKR